MTNTEEQVSSSKLFITYIFHIISLTFTIGMTHGNVILLKKVVQETINALKSMMSTNDTIAFSILGEKDKIESLSGIREIVCGMRAFNKDAGHCGEGLIDSKSNVLY